MDGNSCSRQLPAERSLARPAGLPGGRLFSRSLPASVVSSRVRRPSAIAFDRSVHTQPNATPATAAALVEAKSDAAVATLSQEKFPFDGRADGRRESWKERLWVLTFYLEHKVALVGRAVAHGLVPDLALVDGLVVVGAGHDGQQARGAAGGAVAALLDAHEAGRRLAELLAVPEPANCGLGVSALAAAVQLELLALARELARARAGRNRWRLRWDCASFVCLFGVFPKLVWRKNGKFGVSFSNSGQNSGRFQLSGGRRERSVRFSSRDGWRARSALSPPAELFSVRLGWLAGRRRRLTV